MPENLFHGLMKSYCMVVKFNGFFFQQFNLSSLKKLLNKVCNFFCCFLKTFVLKTNVLKNKSCFLKHLSFIQFFLLQCLSGIKASRVLAMSIYLFNLFRLFVSQFFEMISFVFWLAFFN